MRKATTSNFSTRFNKLCDVADFVEGRGRVTEVARFFNVGRTTARNWLMEDICPRDQTLKKTIARLHRYNRLPEQVSLKTLQVWLEKGDTYIPNPFGRSISRVDINQFEFLKLYKTFALISKVTDQMNIDIYSFPDEVLNEVFADLCQQNLDSIHSDDAAIIIQDHFSSLLARST